MRSRSRIRRDRDRDRLNAAIDGGALPGASGQSQVIKMSGMPLTNAQGVLNQRGQLFESLVNERAYLPNPRSDYNTDPYRRGTRREGAVRSRTTTVWTTGPRWTIFEERSLRTIEARSGLSS